MIQNVTVQNIRTSCNDFVSCLITDEILTAFSKQLTCFQLWSIGHNYLVCGYMLQVNGKAYTVTRL